ncbi:MAG: DNA mismatch repair protein MutS [Myxococcota bacterium]|nr:DNA mismatch repair protein MutS [Myxococcota bacterium]
MTLLGRHSWLVANARLVVFVAATALGIAALLGKVGAWAPYGVAAAALAYVVLIFVHRGVDDRERRGRAAVAYDDRLLSRVGGTWQTAPRDGKAYAPPGHPYARDLDIFGQASLFQLLNETPTRSGEERLATWLASPADPKTIQIRQGAVKALAPRLAFRRELAVAAAAEGDDKVDPAALVRWAGDGSVGLTAIRWARWLPYVLVPLTLLTYLASREGWVPRLVPIAAFLVQLLVAGAVRGALARFFVSIAIADRSLGRLRQTFARLETEAFEEAHLLELRRGGSGTLPASRALAKLDFWYGFAEARRSQLGPVLNVLLLWDLVMLFRISDWRDRFGGQAAAWVSGLAEIEALCALAGFAAEHPAAVFPEIESREPLVSARGLAHPLLEAAVANDVDIRGSGHALLLTGSNMSGKSTLLRAIGVNVVLALAGAPVIAQSMRVAVLQLATSMRVEDSLERGVSFFYAEVQRLKLVLDLARDHAGACLFLLDELLLGTNTRERQLASREIVGRLLETGAIGVITTHDLDLTTLEAETQGRVVNAHFRDQLAEGKMAFDYKLRPGVVDTTNALKVLELAGITVRAR